MLKYDCQTSFTQCYILGPGPANTHRPAKILRGRPGPVSSPVPGLVEALVGAAIKHDSRKKNLSELGLLRTYAAMNIW